MYIQLDDLKMYYSDNQTEHKPILVFIHGLGENLGSWHHQIDYFSTKYRVIAMDLRGHDRSDDGTKPITIKQFANDIIALLDALKIEQAHIIGLSMGGIIAQQLALDYQSRLLSISLCDSSSFYSGAQERLAARIEMMKNTTMQDVVKFIVAACLPQGFSQEIYDEAILVFSQNRQTPYIEATRATFGIDYRNELHKISLPTLVLVGELDIVAPLQYSELIHDAIVGSELRIINGAGHLSNLEKPREFNQLIEDFLKKHI